jgi:protein TonB
MVHVVEGRTLAQLPHHRGAAAATSLVFHASVAGLALVAATSVHVTMTTAKEPVAFAKPAVEHLIFIARDSPGPAGGGGGGGNGQSAPIRRAEAIGRDRVTLRVAKPMSTAGHDQPAPTLPQLILDAEPLASGSIDQLGLPFGGVSIGTSLGPGSGGGVGEGIGTGIGPGRGPGYGPGSGGGTSGGAFRPGGSVSRPRVITEVKPSYTHRAMVDHVEGNVLLELVVQSNGCPSHIRVVRSLDSGLDEEAVRAAGQWRFEPGRLNGMPVDVLVTLQVDFHIR